LKLILGLGNPGRAYAATRHNVGWWAVDHLAKEWDLGEWKKDGQSLATFGRVGGVPVRLVKPQTYMNLSGAALITYQRRETWDFTKDLLVIVDEVALPLGRLRIRASGSAGGHNGLKSIEQQLASQNYARLRIGIRPEHEIHDLADFVLAPFSKSEAAVTKDVLGRVTAAAETWMRDGIEAAMNRFNGAGSRQEETGTDGKTN
jgi:PTH1 family peptidyl-tRNA hydrolase